MIKQISVLVLLLLVHFCLQAADAQFKLLKTIGDDRDDYTFFVPVGAAVSDQKEIFILDAKGIFISKYDWNGKFLGRTGNKGKGPSDFFFPTALHLFQNKLYILDRGNKRIAITDLNLKSFQYMKWDTIDTFESNFFPLGEDRYIGNLSNFEAGAGRLGIVDKNGRLMKQFFNKLPVELNFASIKYSNPVEKKMHVFRVGKETTPVLGINENHSQVIVSFSKPDNPVKFYVYSADGELERSFHYPIKDSKYKRSDFLLKATWEEIADKKKYPTEEHYPKIDSMFIFKNHYVIFMGLWDYRKEELIQQRQFCLIFDKTGKLRQEITLNDNLKILSLSKDGYAVGSIIGDETTLIQIYHLKIK